MRTSEKQRHSRLGRTRAAAAEAARKPDSALMLDPDAEGSGLREWFASLSEVTSTAAAFGTRFHLPAAATGRASKGITRQLRRHGFRAVTDPESSSVTKDNHLEVDEQTRARNWGARLAAIKATRRDTARSFH